MTNAKCLLLAVAAALACALAEGQTTDPRFVEGQTALEAGDAEKAYGMLSQLFREYPESVEVNFTLGLAAAASGRLSHAALAFERALQAKPDHDRARLELARTYFAMSQFDLARQEFEKVLARNPPPAVRQNIESFLKRIQSQAKRWAWGGRVQATGFYDDNVNFGPNADYVETILGTLEIDASSQPQDAFGAAASVSLMGSYDLGKRLGWSLAGGGDYFQSWIQDAGAQETLFLKAYAGPQSAGAKHRLQMPLKVEHIIYGHEPLLYNYGWNPVLTLAGGARLQWITALSAEYRDYIDLDDRDAPYGALGETVRVAFGAKRHTAGLSVQGFLETPESEPYKNAGFEVALSGEFNLVWALACYTRLKYKDTQYAEKSDLALEDDPRHDTQTQFMVGLTRPVTRRWGVDANYQWTLNGSNFGLYDYDRNMVGVSAYVAF